MREFVEYLVKQIVTKPEEVIVEESQEADGTFLYTIRVSVEDIGTVIGREGRTINSVRNVAKVKAIKDGTRIKVYLDSGQENMVEKQVESTQEAVAESVTESETAPLAEPVQE